MRLTQLTPFEDVRIVPFVPAATNTSPPRQTANKVCEVPDVLTVQFVPLVELEIPPWAPTTTNVPPPKAAAKRFPASPEVRNVHPNGFPSGSGLVARLP